MLNFLEILFFKRFLNSSNLKFSYIQGEGTPRCDPRVTRRNNPEYELHRISRSNSRRSIIRVNYFNYFEKVHPRLDEGAACVRLCAQHTSADFPRRCGARKLEICLAKRQHCKRGTRESQAATMSSNVERNPG